VPAPARLAEDPVDLRKSSSVFCLAPAAPSALRPPTCPAGPPMACKSSEPSRKGGMNSEPSLKYTGKVNPTTARLAAHCGLGVPEHESARPLLHPVQKAADGVSLFGVVTCPPRSGWPSQASGRGLNRKGSLRREEHAHRRVQGDGQESSDGHGQVLR